MVLTHAQAKRFYDRFGRRQGWQAVYEDRAIEALIARAAFDQAHSVYEFGCGTGRLAECLLREHLPADATYHAVDASETMVRLTRARLAPFGERVTTELTAGDMQTGRPDASTNRFLATYVLDLLSDGDSRLLLDEARRTLRPGGRLCLVSLTFGAGRFSRLVTSAWRALYRFRPRWLGGCRPIRLTAWVAPPAWRILHHQTATRLGISSEIVVAEPR